MGMPPVPRSNAVPLSAPQPQPQPQPHLQPQMQPQLQLQPQLDMFRPLTEPMLRDINDSGERNEMELWSLKLGEFQEQKALALSMLHHIERMAQECEKTKNSILRGLNEAQTDKNETEE